MGRSVWKSSGVLAISWIVILAMCTGTEGSWHNNKVTDKMTLTCFKKNGLPFADKYCFNPLVEYYNTILNTDALSLDNLNSFLTNYGMITNCVVQALERKCPKMHVSSKLLREAYNGKCHRLNLAVAKDASMAGFCQTLMQANSINYLNAAKCTKVNVKFPRAQNRSTTLAPNGTLTANSSATSTTTPIATTKVSSPRTTRATTTPSPYLTCADMSALQSALQKAFNNPPSTTTVASTKPTTTASTTTAAPTTSTTTQKPSTTQKHKQGTTVRPTTTLPPLPVPWQITTFNNSLCDNTNAMKCITQFDYVTHTCNGAKAEVLLKQIACSLSCTSAQIVKLQKDLGILTLNGTCVTEWRPSGASLITSNSWYMSLLLAFVLMMGSFRNV